MSSKQQATHSVIFTNVNFKADENGLFYGLKPHYSGVDEVVKLYHEGNNGESIHAIQINLKSDKSADQLTGQTHFRIFDKEYTIQSLTKSVIASKLNSNEKLGQILQDLSHNYMGIERISRFYYEDQTEADQIRIDFKTEASVTKILKDGYILIDGKRRPVQPYRSLVEIPKENPNPNVVAAKQPVTNGSSKPAPRTSPKYLTEARVKELFAQQQMQLEAMINAFENKWNTRLASLATSSTNPNADQLSSTFKDLSMVCEQFNQQNAQMQRQLNILVHRMQCIQMNSNAEQQSLLTIQNGH